jgi:hypothetical protein
MLDRPRSRSCAFCGGLSLNREHVWPEWLRSFSHHSAGRYQTGIVGSTEGLRDWTSTSFNHTVRRVCPDCNGGWMSQLEGQAKPILVPMIQGETRLLSPSEQAVIARSLFKTALAVALTNDHKASQLPSPHYHLLRERGTLPPSSQVWLSRLDAPDIEAGFWVQRFEWWDREVQPERRREAYAFLITALGIVGFGLVFDATNTDGSDLEIMRPGPALLPPVANRIWPPGGQYSVLWPPQRSLSASNLAEIMDAIRHAGGDENPPGSIVPGGSV